MDTIECTQKLSLCGLGTRYVRDLLLLMCSMGPPREKRDGVIRHILERENGNWMEKIALFRE